MEVYTIRELNFSYPDRKEPTLKNINLDIGSGEFVTICGKSGCGKTTLLRHLKPILTPHGDRSGTINYFKNPIGTVTPVEMATSVGFVSQNPDNQIVTDKVWHELAFGLESLGVKSNIIWLRTAEMASFFGIEHWFMKNVSELSGGEKQLLNLASVMAMQPKVLILDEPTSQLDPIAASEFLRTVQKINLDLGITVIMTEHRLEEVFPMSDKIVVMETGKVICCDNAQNVGKMLKESENDMVKSLPSAMSIFAGIKQEVTDNCPVSVRDGRNFLDMLLNESEITEENKESKREKAKNNGEYAIELSEVWFKYNKNEEDVLQGLVLSVPQNKLYAFMGGNGSGKTTTLSVISGINKAYRGKVKLFGKKLEKYANRELFNKFLAVLPQNPQALFVKKTVELDLLSFEPDREKVYEIAKMVEIEKLLSSHPYDLSGGEQQRAALAKVLLTQPKILMLDEPTKGLDNCFKEKFAEILKKLIKSGVTVFMVSHDIEFCAKYADICALCFNGRIISESEPHEFFGENSFYTTAANRISRHKMKGAITNEEVIEQCAKMLKKS